MLKWALIFLAAAAGFAFLGFVVHIAVAVTKILLAGSLVGFAIFAWLHWRRRREA